MKEHEERIKAAPLVVLDGNPPVECMDYVLSLAKKYERPGKALLSQVFTARCQVNQKETFELGARMVLVALAAVQAPVFSLFELLCA